MQTILITGGFGRLGVTLTEELERRGARPLLTSRDARKVERFNTAMEATDRNPRALVLKFTSEDEIRSFVSRVVKQFGPIEGLVYGAHAVLDYRPVGNIPFSYWEECARIALGGAEALSSQLVALRERSAITSIVNIVSIYGLQAPNFSTYEDGQNPSPVYYGAVKAGVLALTRYLAAHWGSIGVRVNAVTPGGILSDQTPGFLSRYGATVPMGRMVTAQEVSSAIAFLLSNESGGMTGANIVVDGGKTAW